MRIALVSPYSWSYPGGVTRHIEALAQQYLANGAMQWEYLLVTCEKR